MGALLGSNPTGLLIDIRQVIWGVERKTDNFVNVASYDLSAVYVPY